MLRSVFGKALRDQRRSLPAWACGVAALVGLTLVFWPTVRDTPGIQELAEQMPPALREIFGADDMTSPSGYLASRLFSLMVSVLFIIFAIARGTAAIAGDEERGGLELLLALPLSRRRVAAERYVALLTGLGVLGGVLLATLLLGVAAMDMGVAWAQLARAAAAVTLLAAVFGSLAFAIGCTIARRGVALGLASAAAVAAYLLDTFARIDARLETLRQVSPFWHALREQPLTDGMNLAGAALLVAASVGVAAAGLERFARRDIT